jgi:hypothetical protein
MKRDELEARPGSPERRAEAAKLTSLMEASSPFTYLRLGDGELALLLQWQRGETPDSTNDTPSAKPIFDAYSVNGLKQADYLRLIRAYESCSYLDTFERVPYSAEHFHHLHLNRDPCGINSPRPSLSQIFYEWGYCELPSYVNRHRCVIAGAEGRLLEELLADSRYQAATTHFWNFPVGVKCVGIRNCGRQYWNHLEQINDDLVEELRSFKADTLFLSLASGAKILCHEIAASLGVRCFDLGALLLALTYSATPGNSVVRNSHNPYFFRVPLDAYMDCLMRAHPDLPNPALVAKAQAQLCFDLMKKEPMNSFVPEIRDRSNFDPNRVNLQNYRESKHHYVKLFGAFLTETHEGRELARAFREWCADHELGGNWVRTKRLMLRVASRLKRFGVRLLGQNRV